MRSRRVIALLVALVLILSGSPYLAATLLFSHGHHHVLSQRHGASITLVFHHHEVEDAHSERHSSFQLISPQTVEKNVVSPHWYSPERDAQSEQRNDHMADLPGQSVGLPSQPLKPSPRVEPLLLLPVLVTFHVPAIPDLALWTTSQSSKRVVPILAEQLRSVILLV